MTAVGTIISHRVARSTGATIIVERTGDGSWVEQEPGWMTLCLNHASCVLHDTRSLAMRHAAEPEGWCGDCGRIAYGDAPRIHAGKVR